MTFRVPSRGDLIKWLTEESRDQIPNANLDVGEPYQVMAAIYGTGQWSTVPPMQYAAQQILPDTADGDFVARHGRWRRMPRRAAGAAFGLMLIDGTIGTVLGGGVAVNDEGGHAYTTAAAQIVRKATWLPVDIIASDPAYPDRFVVRTSAGMAVDDAIDVGGFRLAIRSLPGGGGVIVYGEVPIDSVVGLAVSPAAGAVVPIVASATGDEYNRRPGDTLTIQSAPTGIVASAIALRVSDGQNDETEKEWTERMQLRDTEHPAGGNRSQLVLWMLGFASKLERDLGEQMLYALGVARGYVYPLYRNLGTADLLPQGVPGARHLSPMKLGQIQNYINPEPTDGVNIGVVGMGADILVKDHVDLPVDCYVQIFGAAGFPPDWVGRFTVAAGSTAARLLTGTSPVGVVVPGGRIAIQAGGGFEVRQVVMVDAGGLSVDPPLPDTPPVGEVIYPGSSLVQPVRDSLADLFSRIGPGDTVPRPTRYPRPTSDEPAELRKPNIDHFVMKISGMRTCAIVAPATDVIPPPQVQIVPRRIIVEHLP